MSQVKVSSIVDASGGNKPNPAEEGGVVTDEWIAETIAKLLP